MVAPHQGKQAALELTHPIDKWGPERAGLIKAQELAAYTKAWKATPADLERAWRAWIAKEDPIS